MTLTWIVGVGAVWTASSVLVALALGALIGRGHLPVRPRRRRTASAPRSLRHQRCTAVRTLTRG